MSSALLRLDDVSTLTGIPVATLRYWRHKGEGPPSARLGRRVVYRRVDVETWIDEQFMIDHPHNFITDL